MMQSSTRYYHTYSYVLHPLKDGDKKEAPDVYTQAENLGGTFTRITRGNPPTSVANFSPSILQHQGTTYIAWRSQPEAFCFRWDRQYFYLNDTPTDIYIGILADDDTILGAKPLRSKKHRLSYEDPRLFEGPDGEMYVEFVASTYASQLNKGGKNFFDMPKIVVCHIDENLEATSAAIPPIGHNRAKDKTEKNWCFFSHEGELQCLYSTRPIRIEREKGPAIEVNSDILDSVTGGNPTFNSLPPIEINEGYLVFYHWKYMDHDQLGNHYLKYHLGAYILNKQLTQLTHMCNEPLFTGSLKDSLINWTDERGAVMSRQPACILPFGAFIDNQELVMSLGVNDAFNGIFRCPVNHIISKMTKTNIEPLIDLS